MTVVSTDPELRFQHKYDGRATVIEGSELQKLVSRFVWHSSRARTSHNDPTALFIFATCAAYKSVHGGDAVARALDGLQAGDW